MAVIAAIRPKSCGVSSHSREHRRRRSSSSCGPDGDRAGLAVDLDPGVRHAAPSVCRYAVSSAVSIACEDGVEGDLLLPLDGAQGRDVDVHDSSSSASSPSARRPAARPNSTCTRPRPSSAQPCRRRARRPRRAPRRRRRRATTRPGSARRPRGTSTSRPTARRQCRGSVSGRSTPGRGHLQHVRRARRTARRRAASSASETARLTSATSSSETPAVGVDDHPHHRAPAGRAHDDLLQVASGRGDGRSDRRSQPLPLGRSRRHRWSLLTHAANLTRVAAPTSGYER